MSLTRLLDQQHIRLSDLRHGFRIGEGLRLSLDSINQGYNAVQAAVLGHHPLILQCIDDWSRIGKPGSFDQYSRKLRDRSIARLGE